ncbi:Pyrrolysine biosynthesis protein PylC [Desulfamplus magnetovallimortis]|uniref:Pyrrolysine biosynthesis protein PylC n=1 Tax=Desulfamplus magnetovallimortis TaxID=1246637 RepID=A0A1W1HAR9_9BACT|nr:3-methylornithine--L-lysine ligase PylC [Desulfamplus magnetovallimortis]SLM29594.1 Pyrrolysine biosynthesis protein PylC [Desulfamplus magnetovallimortis]
MKIVIAGGNLQGVEAAYLALKAGWHVTVIDKQPRPPASGLCHKFIELDLKELTRAGGFIKKVRKPNEITTTEGTQNAVKKDTQITIKKAFQNADFILPALENKQALDALTIFADEHNIPLAFSPEAYAVSSSKKESDKLFADIGIPAPIPWPHCGFPAIGKPDNASGSKGITILKSAKEFQSYINLESSTELPVIQQYIDGPSYSIEVMGFNGNYRALEITELFMDDLYDCCRVTSPVDIPLHLVESFENISISIAKSLNLKGIMDVEVILHENRLKVLEIDARLPSQTPTAVFHSTGINMVEMLGEIFVNSHLPTIKKSCGASTAIQSKASKKHVIYEHIKVNTGQHIEKQNRDKKYASLDALYNLQKSYDLQKKTVSSIEFCGEHIMSTGTPLYLITDFFGADEAITDFREDASQFVATLIFCGNSNKDVQNKRNACIDSIQRWLK